MSTTTATATSSTQNLPLKGGISYTPLHSTFAAEATGVDFNHVTPEVVEEIKAGLAKYGVLVFRKTGLDDDRHVEMSKLFGDLDDVAPHVGGLGQTHRLSSLYLFDVGNISPDGEITQPGSKRDVLLKCNAQFHVDSAFNPRRSGYSLLRAHELPPKGTGGDTEFADSRQAYDDLPESTKVRIKDYVVNNSQHHCRRTAAPNHPFLEADEHNPAKNRFGKHKLVQLHEPSGRKNLYIASHAYSVEGMPVEESQKELKDILDHTSQPKYCISLQWNDPGDLIIWDNTCVMHRAVPGSFEGKYRRDMRRTTVHDMSSQAWGLNEKGATWRSGLP